MPLGLGSLTRAICNRARRGLYAGRKVLSGNRISEDGGNKSRRTWKPNSHNKRLYSHVLGHMVQLRVTAAALRDIDKVGGIDRYILTTPDHRLQSDVAADLRQQMVEQLLSNPRRLKHGPHAKAVAALDLLPPAAAVAAAAAARQPRS